MSGQIANCRCVGCGCTDAQACPGGCYWIVVDRAKGTGLCSRCDLDARDPDPIDIAATRAIVAQAMTGDTDAIQQLGVWTFRHLDAVLDELEAARAKAVTA